MMEDLIKQIVELEYEMMDKVNNIGGRASCQNDCITFEMMRTSQFTVWTGPLLQSYYQDLLDAKAEGRNLLTEKYAWMMEPALPEEFAKVSYALPVFSDERRARMEETVAVQVAWAEEFAQRYPHLSGRGRPIHTTEDTPYSTSVETYARGELSTYSDRTERMYHDFVLACREQGRNLTAEARQAQLRLQGWPSLQAAEDAVAARAQKQ